ncbi:GNAT family N-acetyltransferase [Caulobacter sp. SLTY]|uniref:GNAT family N-acetyltransferase n=1 Tax=Caulobacter sp. SLTY TaxID=2683262 RepID=UPI001412C765|nr:GNAT family N-acetyltransferase [Caulobacter sp. SLTY]NBB14945.1 GNAT family N-acetyltransferase [Caulobacter sp. SLTY]
MSPAPSAAPVVETERLRLRPHAPDDFEASLALWSDPEVTRFIGGRPAAGEEVWARVLRYIGHWTALGYGFWAVEEKATGRFIGEAGFADFRRTISPSLSGMVEMGWALAPSVHGKGYATEAVQGALAWGDAVFDVPVCCIISPGNGPSVRVAEKAGFRELTHTTYHDEPTVIYRRDPV